MASVVCVGCGLDTDSQGRLTIDAAPWPFGCQPGQGFAQPVGCGSDGRLWAPPRQIVQSTLFSGGTPGLDYNAPGGGVSAEGFSREFSLRIENPDPCRRLSGILLIEIDVRLFLPPRSQCDVGAVGNIAWTGRNDDNISHQILNEFTRSLTVSIPPGGSQTLAWNVHTNMRQNNGKVTSVSNVARLIAVSSQPI